MRMGSSPDHKIVHCETIENENNNITNYFAGFVYNQDKITHQNANLCHLFDLK